MPTLKVTKVKLFEESVILKLTDISKICKANKKEMTLEKIVM